MSRLGLGAVLTIAIVHGTAQASSLPGIVAAYGFEENGGTTTADASGSGITAILVGATWTTQGKFGNALMFDGVGAHVNAIEDAPGLHLTSAMTLEAWIKPSVIPNNWGDVIYKGNDNYFLMGTTYLNGRPACGGIFNGVNTVTFGPTALTANVWTHLAATYNGSTIRLYVNGAQVVQSSRSGSIATSYFPLQIGGDNFFHQYFAGTIDEVRVYNRALTQAEIQQDMNTPVVSPVVDSDPPTAPSSPIATAFSGTQNNLNWIAATDNVGVARYKIERCRRSDCVDFTEIGATTGTTYSDTGLALNTVYTYRVRAIDASGNLGTYSGVTSAATLTSTAIPGLVAAYSFDAGTGSSVADFSGGNNVGTILGATWTDAGRYGRALAFNGTSSKVTVPDSPSLDLATGMTLEAWCYPLSLPAIDCSTPDCPWMDVIFKETDCYYLEASSNVAQLPEVGSIVNGQKHIVFGPKTLPLNAWSHLTLTYDGALLRFYVNGTIVASTPATGTILASSRPLQIGGDTIYSQWFNGTIDEVRVYNRGLSESEVQADMNTPIENPQNNPTPATSGLTPSAIATGSPEFTLTVPGVGFVPGSLVEWNGATRATTFVSSNEIRAQILASDVATVGNAQVTVFNAPPIGGTSNARTFAVCAESTWYLDADGDTFGDSAGAVSACAQPAGYVSGGGDCDDANAAVWTVPGEALSLGFPDGTTVVWSDPASPGGTSLGYDALRTSLPYDFVAGTTCLASDEPGNAVIDAESPVADSAYYYLVRARNVCGQGSLGTASSGSERAGGSCP